MQAHNAYPHAVHFQACWKFHGQMEKAHSQKKKINSSRKAIQGYTQKASTVQKQKKNRNDMHISKLVFNSTKNQFIFHQGYNNSKPNDKMSAKISHSKMKWVFPWRPSYHWH